jgi:hypothetical protein
MRSGVVDFRSLRRQKEKEIAVYKLDAITCVYVRADGTNSKSVFVGV